MPLKADREKKRDQLYSMTSTENVIRHMDQSTEFWQAWLSHIGLLLCLVCAFIEHGGSDFLILTAMWLLPIVAIITTVVHLVWIRKDGSKTLWRVLGAFSVLAVIQFVVLLAILCVWAGIEDFWFRGTEGNFVSSHVDRVVMRLSVTWLILGVGAFLAASKLYKNVEAPLRRTMENQLMRLQWEEEQKL